MSGAPGRTRTADAGLRTASLCPLSYGGAASIVPPAGRPTGRSTLEWPRELPSPDDRLLHEARLPPLRRVAAASLADPRRAWRRRPVRTERRGAEHPGQRGVGAGERVR